MDWSNATIEEIQKQLPNRTQSYLEHKMADITNGLEAPDWRIHECLECGKEDPEINGLAGNPRKWFCSDECATRCRNRIDKRPKDKYEQCHTCFNEIVDPFDPTQKTDVTCMTEQYLIFEQDCPAWNKTVKWRR